VVQPIVTVRGEASREVEPELATVSASVAASGSTAEQVTADLANGSERLAAVVERFAAAVERSASSGLYVHPVTDRRNATKVTGYRGTFSTQIVVQDFALLSDLVLALSTVPRAELSGPSWSLRPDALAYRDVRLDAIADGRRRADDYAAAFGARVADLLEISDANGGFDRPMARGMAFAASAKSGATEASFDFEPQQQTVSGQVTLRFTLTSPALES
jgi:uncharacterized protein YggE